MYTRIARPTETTVDSYLGLVRQLGRARSLVIERVGCLLDRTRRGTRERRIKAAGRFLVAERLAQKADGPSRTRTVTA